MLQIKSLGKPEIRLNGEVVYSHKKVRQILCLVYLGEMRRLCPRENLSALLWPEADIKKQLGSLNTLIYHFKKDGLGPYISSTKNSIGTIPEWGAIDFDLQALRNSFSYSTAPLLPDFMRPFELFDGPFLKGIDLSFSPAASDWAFSIQHELESKMLNAYYHLSPLLIRQRSFAKGIEYGRIILEMVPDDEQALIWFIRFLTAQGDVAEAMQTLSEYRQQALNRDPQHRFTPDLITLGTQLSDPSQVVQLMWRTDEEAVALTSSHHRMQPGINVERDRQLMINPKSVPQVVSKLFGREDFISNLQQQLLDPDKRLITLSGMGGIGKTQLALTITHLVANQFKDGAVFVPLREISRANFDSESDVETQISKQLAIETLNSMNVPFHADGESIAVQLIEILERREMFIVYDNFEHLIEGASFFSFLLRSAGKITILVTSRVRLNLVGEYVLNVPPLNAERGEGNLASTDQDKQLLGSGVDLFIDRAHRLNSHLSFKDEELKYIQEICNLTGGLPLAIEHAASWTTFFSLPEIVSEIEKSYSFLRNARNEIDDVHHSIRATLNSSYKHLAAEEKDVLLCLSLLHHEFSREAALEIANCSISILVSLVDRSLIQQVEPGWYRYHPLVAQMILEKQSDWNKVKRDEAESRLIGYFLSIVERWDQEELLWQEIEPHNAYFNRIQEDLFQAWKRGISKGKYVQLAKAAWTFVTYIEIIPGMKFSGDFLTDSVNELSQQVPDELKNIDASPEGYTDLFTQISCSLANIYLLIGDREQSFSVCSKALKLLQGTEFYRTKTMLSLIMCQLAFVGHEGDLGQEEHYQIVLENITRIDRDTIFAVAEAHRATFHKARMEYEVAERIFVDAVEMLDKKYKLLLQMIFIALIDLYSRQSKHSAVISIVEQHIEAPGQKLNFAVASGQFLKGKHLLLSNRVEEALACLALLEDDVYVIQRFSMTAEYYLVLLFCRFETTLSAKLRDLQLKAFFINCQRMIDWLEMLRVHSPVEWHWNMSLAQAALAAGKSCAGSKFEADMAFRLAVKAIAERKNDLVSQKFGVILTFMTHYFLFTGQFEVASQLLAFISSNLSNEIEDIGFKRLLIVYKSQTGAVFESESDDGLKSALEVIELLVSQAESFSTH